VAAAFFGGGAGGEDGLGCVGVEAFGCRLVAGGEDDAEAGFAAHHAVEAFGGALEGRISFIERTPVRALKFMCPRESMEVPEGQPTMERPGHEQLKTETGGGRSARRDDEFAVDARPSMVSVWLLPLVRVAERLWRRRVF